MSETKIAYTEEEILEIFKEQHRLCSPLDPEADPWTKITSDMTIREWRRAQDLVEWRELSRFLNQEFRVQIGTEEWKNTLEPEKTKKLIGVCRLLSKHAKKDNYKPKTLFGKPCLKAGVFLTIKKNLKNKGVNVIDLRPSSSLENYITRYFSPVLEEITLTRTKPIDKIEARRKKKGFWNAINIFDPDRYELLTGEIKTFRDLTEKIIEEKIEASDNPI